MKKVGIIGTGNWGTTLGFLVSKNVISNLKYFKKEILIYGIVEEFEGKSMDKLINEDHENKKYLPGIKLPDNLCYTSDIQLFSDIDIIIVALPHQFIDSLIKFKEYLKKDIIVLSVVKGVIEYKVSFTLVSDYINEIWGCSTNVLMGANIASDVAKGLLGNILYKCEGTLGYHQEYDRKKKKIK